MIRNDERSRTLLAVVSLSLFLFRFGLITSDEVVYGYFVLYLPFVVDVVNGNMYFSRPE